jgi:hypothetical protein
MTKIQDAKRVHTSTQATEQLGHPGTNLEITSDLPRFEALAEEHERQLARAVKGRTGRLTALSGIAAIVFGTGSPILA